MKTLKEIYDKANIQKEGFMQSLYYTLYRRAGGKKSLDGVDISAGTFWFIGAVDKLCNANDRRKGSKDEVAHFWGKRLDSIFDYFAYLFGMSMYSKKTNNTYDVLLLNKSHKFIWFNEILSFSSEDEFNTCVRFLIEVAAQLKGCNGTAKEIYRRDMLELSRDIVQLKKEGFDVNKGERLCLDTWNSKNL